MFKILLVDDEVAICRGMKKLILKADVEGVSVAEAYDGVEALDLMKAFDPDVLLTDMRMPRMDGLQLLGEAKKRKPELLTAVISAYSDYEYVREAILTHASDDYLLKPATAKEIQELLHKLKGKHHELASGREQEALGKLMHGIRVDNVPQTMLNAEYALLLLCAGPYSNGVADLNAGEAWWSSKLLEEDLASCEELGIRHWVLPGERPNERMLLLASAGDARDRFQACLDRFLPSLQSQPMPVAGVMASGFVLNELHATSKQLRRELVHSLIFAKTHVWSLSHSGQKEPEADRTFAEKTAEAIAAVGQRLEQRFQEALDGLMASWEIRNATQYRIQQTLFRLLTEFGEQGLKGQLDLEMAVSGSRSYAELKEHVTALFHDLFKGLQPAHQAAPVHKLVGQVEHYLKQHYRKTITLHSLSKEFKLVPNYLSVLFKKEMGITPLEYLMEYRIREAKRLMDERPYMLLKQVASEVGYPDPLYFSRVFKKLTGQSPSEYANSRQRGGNPSNRP